MNNPSVFHLTFIIAVMAVFVSGCSGTMETTDVPHGDTVTATIDTTNALSIAASAYRVAAIDVPFTASVAMDDVGNINAAACTDSSALSGSMTAGMGQMGMDMQFNNCQLQSANPSAHALVVNGGCNNTAESASVETVTGDEITFSTSTSTVADHTLSLHGFSVTRDTDNMTKASGTLHLLNDDIVMFNTTKNFTGTAQAPTAGTMVVTGANNTSVRFTVSSAGFFDMDVDVNGDGDYNDMGEALFSSEGLSTFSNAYL